MKKLLFTVTIFCISIVAFGQEIKIKDNTVFVDGKECLKINVSDPNNITFLDMNGKEIIFLKYIHNTKYGSVYCKITFLEQKKSFTSKNYIYTKKLLIKRLVAEKLLENCSINSDKLDVFLLKFDENVEN